MTDEKRKTSQQAGIASLELGGAIYNVTGADLVMTNGHRGFHSQFKTEEETETAAVILTPQGAKLLDKHTAEPETVEAVAEQAPVATFAKILRSPLIGLDGEMEDIGTINHVFRLVKPRVPCIELKKSELSGQIGTLLQEISLMRLPWAETDSRKSQKYYVLTPGAACVGIMKYDIYEVDLDCWLVPALPMRDEAGKVIGYGAFAPAKYLIGWQE